VLLSIAVYSGQGSRFRAELMKICEKALSRVKLVLKLLAQVLHFFDDLEK